MLVAPCWVCLIIIVIMVMMMMMIMKMIMIITTRIITIIPNGNNAAEGENNIKYRCMLAVTRLWTELWRIDLYKTLIKGHGHNRDKWSDYDEDNVPFERLQKVYVLNEDSLEQRMNIFHGQLYSLYRDGRKFCLPLQLFFW